MYKLSLFPLNTVLFPNMPLRLHIFEPRYQLMIGRCIEQQQPFGVLLLKSGAEVQGPGGKVDPHLVGCAASILQMQPIGDGRMNIVAVGQQRFRVHSLEYDEPYLAGYVENLELGDFNPQQLARDDRWLRPWVERYWAMLSRAENVQADPVQLPQDTLALAYLAAALLQIDSDEKQALLAVNRATELLERVRAHYRKEVTVLSMMLENAPPELDSPFSLN